MANKYATLKDLFTAIADAIRSKTGSTNTIVADDFPDAISDIVVNSGSNTDFNVVTAGAGDVRSTKYFLNSSGVKTKGTLATKSASSVKIDGNTVTIPAGIYDSQVIKTVTTSSGSTTGTELIYKQEENVVVYPDANSTQMQIQVDENIGAIGAIELFYNGQGTGLYDYIEAAYLLAFPITSGSSQYYLRGTLLLGDGSCLYVDQENNPIYIDLDGSQDIMIDISDTGFYFINNQYLACCVYGAAQTS